MTPFTVHDVVRRVAAEAHSALPNAPVVAESEARPASARLVRVRLGLSSSLRRLADRVEPRRQAVPAPVGGRQG
jgi:hypothetical protein